MFVDVAKVDVVDDATLYRVANHQLLFLQHMLVGRQTLDHLFYLSHSRLVALKVAELLVIGERRVEIVVGGNRVVVEQVALAQPIERIRLLIIIADVHHLLIVADGFLVLFQIEMALGVDVVVDGALVGCEGLELWDERIEVFAGFFVVPVVIVTYGDEGAESWVELVATVELVDRKSTRLNSSHIAKSRMPSSA